MKKVLCMLIMTIAIGIMGGGTRTYADEIKDNSEIEEHMFRWNFFPAMFQLLQPSYFLKYLEEIGPFLPEFSVYNASIVFHSYQSTFLIYNLLTLEKKG